jgi:hypothetical protein
MRPIPGGRVLFSLALLESFTMQVIVVGPMAFLQRIHQIDAAVKAIVSATNVQ